MDIAKLFGLPAHPLLVHLPIVMLPLVGVAVIAMAFSPRVRDRIGWITVGLAFVGFVGVVLAAQSGEALQDSVTRTAALREHTSLADGMQLLALVFFAVTLGVMVVHHWSKRSDDETARPPTWLTPAIGALAVVVALGVNVQLVRVGHNGAKASWQQVKIQADRGEGRGEGG